jgi:hypothetical protein
MAAAAVTPEPLIRWGYVWSALAGLGVMIAAIMIGNLWFLNFVHVFSSLLWTGIDLFMGFVPGPILRRMDISIRRDVARRLTPRTLFLMPTVSIISGTTGWFLAVELGYTALDWPAYGWVVAALVLVTLMTIQGLGFLTPVNVMVCLELQKSAPEQDRRLDAALFLCGRYAGDDASCDHCRHDALSRGFVKNIPFGLTIDQGFSPS